ncbi:Calmodulin-binding transcription activator 2 [Dissostichus eleginoides]|uniref:Calmodulin-binding transcription activator 2 n=1 Tax=Dissostichus eleginoides TaxID=100907 RepID=A0AAD9F746_DISEL|nr:Calmodulin-binding transcription activator 2 [Dissostichus eleginoides]
MSNKEMVSTETACPASVCAGTLTRHDEWLSCSLKTRPKNGSIILYNRKKVKYRKDGYCWKKRKDGKTTREDHMKLKVQGTEVLLLLLFLLLIIT